MQPPTTPKARRTKPGPNSGRNCAKRACPSRFPILKDTIGYNYDFGSLRREPGEARSWVVEAEISNRVAAPMRRCYRYLSSNGGHCMFSLFPRLFRLVLMALFLIPPISFAQTVDNPDPGAPLKVGFLLDSLMVERCPPDLDAFQNRAKALGSEVLVVTAEGTNDQQHQHVQHV